LPWGHYKYPRGAKIAPGGITKALGVGGLPLGHHKGPRGARIALGASQRP
jgi:hypothetical protein